MRPLGKPQDLSTLQGEGGPRRTNRPRNGLYVHPRRNPLRQQRMSPNVPLPAGPASAHQPSSRDRSAATGSATAAVAADSPGVVPGRATVAAAGREECGRRRRFAGAQKLVRADELTAGDRRWEGRRGPGPVAVELRYERVRVVQFGHPTDPQHVNQPADGAPVRQQIELLPAATAIVPATLELIHRCRHLLLVLLVGTTIVAVLPIINCVFFSGSNRTSAADLGRERDLLKSWFLVGNNNCNNFINKTTINSFAYSL
uniref:(northern house mosquito) hypothetical protein n=1 Tax=Culex pipiens TaxID=7175 RepID=A0A8D8F7T2_CULPI